MRVVARVSNPWVTTKLLLVITVALVGTFVIGPAENQMLRGGADAWGRLIAGGVWDVAALATATALSVFKPGRTWRRPGDHVSLGSEL